MLWSILAPSISDWPPHISWELFPFRNGLNSSLYTSMMGPTDCASYYSPCVNIFLTSNFSWLSHWILVLHFISPLHPTYHSTYRLCSKCRGYVASVEVLLLSLSLYLRDPSTTQYHSLGDSRISRSYLGGKAHGKRYSWSAQKVAESPSYSRYFSLKPSFFPPL